MANTPTTRPPNRGSERRPPKGPHVARKSDVKRTREHLVAGAEALRASLPEVAETLEALSRPFGHRMLVQDRETGRVPEGTTNLSISVPPHLRKAIQDAASDSAESEPVKVLDILGRVASAGIRRVLDGEVRPREIPREPRGASVEKVNLNVPVDTAVLEELREQLPSLGERLGFERKATLAGIAFRVLLDEYGVEYEPSSKAFPDKSHVILAVPPRLATAIRRRLLDVDQELRQTVVEGYMRVLAGSWKPLEIPRAARGSEFERERVSVWVDTALLDQVRKKAKSLQLDLGYRVTPPSIAIDYLISELGLEDLADAEYGVSAE